MCKRILVAIDKSESSQHVFAEAVSLALATSARVLLLHVLSPLDEGYPTPVYPGPDSLYPSLHEEAIKAYSQQWQVFEREGLERVRSLNQKAIQAGVIAEFSQNVGDPGHTICDLARTWDADLILMGRRGRAGLSEFFLGSVSNYVLHHAPCSVLIIQGQDAIAAESNSEKAEVTADHA